jgi:hypothetical protein
MKIFVRTAGSIGTPGPVYFAVECDKDTGTQKIMAQLHTAMAKNLDDTLLIFLCGGLDFETVLAVGAYDGAVVDCIKYIKI